VTGPRPIPGLAPFRSPVGGIGVKDLPPLLQAAAKDLEARFPGLAFVLVVMEFGDQGGAAHVSNCHRDSAVGTLREYCAEIERRHRGSR
jgi:hypothetical protein